MSCVCRTLGTTSTYPNFGQRRAYYWPGDPGTLQIDQGTKSGEYLVEEQADVPFPCRAWLIAKQDAEGAVYEVRVDDAGKWHCTCPGWTCHRGVYRCQHSDAMSALVESGDLCPVYVATHAAA